MMADMAGECGAPFGREEQLECLFRSEYASLLRFACFLVDDPTIGEELVQEAFVRSYQAWDRLREPAAAPAYLRSTVLNLARSRLRRRRVIRRHPVAAVRDVASAEDVALLREDQRAVLEALRSLPRRQRECLALRFYLGLSGTEIAQTLQISPGSVKSHTHRAMGTLAARLGQRR